MNDITFKKLTELLQQVNRSFINSLDIDEAYSKFHETFVLCLDIAAPEVNITIPAHKVERETWYAKGMKSSRTLTKLFKNKGKHPPEHPASQA